MATKNRTLYSDLAIPPGETLAEELEARGMTQKELAIQMNRPPQVVSEIINAKKSITPETALGLETVLGISAGFWLNLETDYQLTLARNRQKDRAKADVAPQQPGLRTAPRIADKSEQYGADTVD